MSIGYTVMALLSSGCHKGDYPKSASDENTDREDANVSVATDVCKSSNHETEIRVGVLSEEISQHPILVFPPEIADDGSEMEGEGQFYFGVGEPEELEGQIIVIHPAGMKIPTETGRKIELTGVSEPIDLGGDEGTKPSYQGETFHLKTWKYLE